MGLTLLLVNGVVEVVAADCLLHDNGTNDHHQTPHHERVSVGRSACLFLVFQGVQGQDLCYIVQLV